MFRKEVDTISGKNFFCSIKRVENKCYRDIYNL